MFFFISSFVRKPIMDACVYIFGIHTLKPATGNRTYVLPSCSREAVFSIIEIFVKIDDSDVNKSLQTSHVMRFFVTKPVSRLCCETSVAGFKIAY